MRTHISFNSKVKKTQISETPTHFKISGVPVVVDDAVMNGVTYPAAENEKGLDSLVNRVVTLRHPFDAKGNPIDAYDPQALQNQFSGGHVTKRYKVGKVNMVDIEIKKSILLAQDGGEAYHNRLTNKEEIGVSTGLYTNVVNNTATNQEYNHLAMLEEGEEPAGGDATKMKFNGSAETLVVNVDEFISNGMDNSLNDQREALSAAIKQRFAGLPQTYAWLVDWSSDSVIFEVESAGQYKTYQADWSMKDGKIELSQDVSEVKRKTVWQKITAAVNSLTGLFANGQNIDDNKNGRGQRDQLNNEELPMLTREKLIALLTGKGIAVNANATDAELEQQLDQALAAKPEIKPEATDISAAVTAAVNAAIKPLNDKLAQLETDSQTEALARKAATITAIMQNNSVYTKEELEQLPETLLNKLADQYVPAFAGSAGVQLNRQTPTNNSTAVKLDLPDLE